MEAEGGYALATDTAHHYECLAAFGSYIQLNVQRDSDNRPNSDNEGVLWRLINVGDGEFDFSDDAMVNPKVAEFCAEYNCVSGYDENLFTV